MIGYSEIRCMNRHTRVSGTYTVPKFYDVVGRRESKLRDVYSRKGRRTVFSTTPGHISLRSECGVCRVSSRSGRRVMYTRESHDGARFGRVETPSAEIIDGYPEPCHHEEVLCR